MEEKEGKQESSLDDFVRWFSRIDKNLFGVVGEKGANLGELYKNRFPVPEGFVITTSAFNFFLKENGLDKKIENILEGGDLKTASENIRKLILSTTFPKELEEEILESYETLGANKLEIEKGSARDILSNAAESVFVSVRSSLPKKEVEKVGLREQDTYLNIKGKSEVLSHVKKCFASLFTHETLKKEGEVDVSKFSVAVVIQKMVDSVKSAVAYTKNGKILIEAIWGYGEGFNLRGIHPDKILLSQELEVLNKKTGDKKFYVARSSSGELTRKDSSEERMNAFVLNNYEIQRIGDFAEKVEDHLRSPQEIEFSIDDSGIYVLQTRNFKGEIKFDFAEEKKVVSQEIKEEPSEEVSKIEEVQEEEEEPQEIEKVGQVTKTKFKLILDNSKIPGENSGLKKVGLYDVSSVSFKEKVHPVRYLEGGDLNEYENLIYDELDEIAPRFSEVWVKLSDITSDVTKNLNGNVNDEKNPSIGEHGIKFLLRHPEILKSELLAIKRIQDKTNVGVIVPNISVIEEFQKFKKYFDEVGLSVKVGVMIETASSIQMIKDFCSKKVNLVLINPKVLLGNILSIDLSQKYFLDYNNLMNPTLIYQLEFLLRVARRNNVETGIVSREILKKEFLRYVIQKEIGFICTTPNLAKKYSEIVFNLEREVLEGTDKEPRQYEVNKEKEEISGPEEKVLSCDDEEDCEKAVDLIEEEREQYERKVRSEEGKDPLGLFG